jgi:hypothetical protein
MTNQTDSLGLAGGTHTPGPWSIIWFGGMQIGHEPTGEAVCTMWGSDTDPADPKHANARLIAAAPELLEALQEIVRKFDAAPDEVKNVPLGIMKARAAITKATGEKP